jgi:hypothetical protein
MAMLIKYVIPLAWSIKKILTHLVYTLPMEYINVFCSNCITHLVQKRIVGFWCTQRCATWHLLRCAPPELKRQLLLTLKLLTILLSSPSWRLPYCSWHHLSKTISSNDLLRSLVFRKTHWGSYSLSFSLFLSSLLTVPICWLLWITPSSLFPRVVS